MKKFSIALALVLTVILASAGIFLAFKGPPQRPASTVPINATTGLADRGRYLANHVALCMDCHSDRRQDGYGFPPIASTLGSGSATCYDESVGFPDFRVCASNLTAHAETGLGGWSDGEVMRAIREGVDKEGKALLPFMPWRELRALSEEDTKAIVAYLRTLSPVERIHPEREVPFMMGIMVNFMPIPLDGDVPDPSPIDPVARGRYLATIGGCRFCHSKVNPKEGPTPDAEYIGGQPFRVAGGNVVMSSNLTPDKTGLGEMSQEAFVALFKRFDNEKARNAKVKAADNTVMPWLSYAGMTEDDLGAIYTFLRSLKPVVHHLPRGNVPEPLPDAPTAVSATDAGADVGGAP